MRSLAIAALIAVQHQLPFRWNLEWPEEALPNTRASAQWQEVQTSLLEDFSAYRVWDYATDSER